MGEYSPEAEYRRKLFTLLLEGRSPCAKDLRTIFGARNHIAACKTIECQNAKTTLPILTHLWESYVSSLDYHTQVQLLEKEINGEITTLPDDSDDFEWPKQI